ncbi:MAG: HAD-IIB family hydrolase [Filomicrobium sp.]
MAGTLIIFSDLDGTLLDHKSYSFDAARPALSRAKAAGVPVILATSKTAAEVSEIADAMGLGTPAIVENGGGIWFPDHADEGLREALDPAGLTYEEILRSLVDLGDKWRSCFTGFSAMSVNDVMRATGLERPAAEKAMLRQHSEPGLWTGTEQELTVFSEAVRESGLQVLQGGRFLHVMGQTNKAARMLELKAAYERLWRGDKVMTAALGDAPNDQEMLETANFGFIIANPNGKQIPILAGEADGRIVRTQEAGPSGWNSAVNGLLDRLGIGAAKEE